LSILPGKFVSHFALFALKNARLSAQNIQKAIRQKIHPADVDKPSSVW
jgi:hypothetical protein